MVSSPVLPEKWVPSFPLSLKGEGEILLYRTFARLGSPSPLRERAGVRGEILTNGNFSCTRAGIHRNRTASSASVFCPAWAAIQGHTDPVLAYSNPRARPVTKMGIITGGSR